MLLKIIFIFVTLSLAKKSVHLLFEEAREEHDIKEFNIKTDVTPLKYDIHIELNNDKTFHQYNGTVKILFVSKKTSKLLAINVLKYIKIESVQLLHKVDNKVIDSFISKNNVYDLLRLRNNNETILEKGHEYEVVIQFKHYLTQYNSVQFFTSLYKYDNDTERKFAATHFQTKYIRDVIPCFDDIALKANFILKITHHKSLIALSNMPGTKKEHDNQTATTTFDETPKMSTYLLAFCISDFISTQVIYNGTKNITIYTAPNKVENTDFGVRWSGKILEAYEKYLNVNFSLPKIDYFVIPEFRFQGMENWGLIVYRDDVFLFNPKTDLLAKYENIVSVVAHELAHQFFGNLVTPKEWRYVWLSEGFATYFSQIILEEVYPDEKYFDRFVIEKMYIAFEIDKGGNGTQLNPLWPKDSINDVANPINYAKAASVIRMINHVITENTFRKMLTNFLNEFQYGSVLPTDLSNEIIKAVVIDQTVTDDINITEFINSWTNQFSYPIVTVKRNYSNKTVHLTQNRYMKTENQNYNATWWIPLNYATKSNPNFNDTRPSDWFKNVKTMELPLTLSSDEWIILNRQETSYYVVNYDEENWKLIINELVNGNYESIHPVNRAQIIRTAFFLGEVNQLDSKIGLGLLAYLNREHEYVPWAVADNVLTSLENMFSTSLYANSFKQLIQHTAGSLYDFYGPEKKENEPRVFHLTRLIAIKWACNYQYKNCRNDFELKSNDVLEKLENKIELEIDPDLKEFIFCHGFQVDEVYEKLWNLALNSTNKSFRSNVFEQLTCHKNTKIFRKYYFAIVQFGRKDELTGHSESEINQIINELYDLNVLVIWDIIQQCLLEDCFTIKDEDDLKSLASTFVYGIEKLNRNPGIDETNSLNILQNLRSSFMFLEKKYGEKFLNLINFKAEESKNEALMYI